MYRQAPVRGHGHDTKGTDIRWGQRNMTSPDVIDEDDQDLHIVGSFRIDEEALSSVQDLSQDAETHESLPAPVACVMCLLGFLNGGPGVYVDDA